MPNTMDRSEYIIGPARGKHKIRPVMLNRRGREIMFYVWQPDGKGTTWYYRMPGHDHRQGDRSRGYSTGFRFMRQAAEAGTSAWLRLGIYQ